MAKVLDSLVTVAAMNWLAPSRGPQRPQTLLFNRIGDVDEDFFPHNFRSVAIHVCEYIKQKQQRNLKECDSGDIYFTLKS